MSPFFLAFTNLLPFNLVDGLLVSEEAIKFELVEASAIKHQF